MSGPSNLHAARAISDACVDRVISPTWGEHLPPLQRAVEVRELAPVEGLLAWTDATAPAPRAGKLTEAELTAHNREFHPIETVEQERPWLWLAYAVAVVAGAAASALLPIWRVLP